MTAYYTTKEAQYLRERAAQNAYAGAVVTVKPKALQTQVGGSHYTDMKIQPIEYILANNIPFPEGNVIKYVSRWRNKGGLKDVRKALHHLQLLVEHEESLGTS